MSASATARTILTTAIVIDLIDHHLHGINVKLLLLFEKLAKCDAKLRIYFDAPNFMAKLLNFQIHQQFLRH